MRWLALALMAAGCLSEPARPHGDGLPIAAGSVLRHDVVTGDLDGDGYDDLIVLGNEGAPGTSPTAFVYWGGESLENPDLRLPLAIDDPSLTAPPVWYEALAASVYVGAAGDERGLVILSGQDAVAPPVMDPQRVTYVSYYRAGDRSLDARAYSSAHHGDFGGYATDPAPVFVAARDPVETPPLREYAAAGLQATWVYDGPLGPTSQSSVESTWQVTPFDELQGAFAIPAAPGSSFEQLLLVTDTYAFRIDSDGPSYTSSEPGAMYATTTFGQRTVRGAAFHGDFYAIASSDVGGETAALAIFDAPAAGSVAAYALLDASQLPPTDVAIGDADGNGTVDVVTLEGQALAVYRDLALDPTMSTYTLASSRESLDNYDLLALGNFFGDARPEIYALDSTDPSQPPRCFHVSGTTLVDCEGE